jgi:chemotaxis protein CheY-P-specific phosphatase CheC
MGNSTKTMSQDQQHLGQEYTGVKAAVGKLCTQLENLFHRRITINTHQYKEKFGGDFW